VALDDVERMAQSQPFLRRLDSDIVKSYFKVICQLLQLLIGFVAGILFAILCFRVLFRLVTPAIVMHTETMNEMMRKKSYGESWKLTLVDRFGVWLSGRQIHRAVPKFNGLRIADIGCGYHAKFARTVLCDVRSALLVDVSLSLDLKLHPKVQVLEGSVPAILEQVPSESVDVALCISVLEHLWDPLEAIQQMRRITAPGGTCLFNVPTWRGKRFLEFSAFRLKTSPAEEMDDHKMYYDVCDFWPLLIKAGFLPHQVRCFRHKFGLNLFSCIDRS
jgi:SAM-dependent methyltransferase